MDPRKLSVKELVSYCLDSQDQDGWNEFVRRFQPLIAGVVTKCVFKRKRPKPDLIDDLIQETFLKLCANNFKALRNFSFKDDHGFFGFLKVVASHVVEDYFREQNSQKHGDGREEEDPDESRMPPPFRPNSLQPAEKAILWTQIDRCLAKLASDPNFARDYAIFWLYYRQGLTAKAISKLPGITLSVKGVESTLLRLTRYVKACLTAPPPRQKEGYRRIKLRQIRIYFCPITKFENWVRKRSFERDLVLNSGCFFDGSSIFRPQRILPTGKHIFRLANRFSRTAMNCKDAHCSGQ